MWLQKRDCEYIQPPNVHELAAATFERQILFLGSRIFPKQRQNPLCFYAHAALVNVYFEWPMQCSLNASDPGESITHTRRSRAERLHCLRYGLVA